MFTISDILLDVNGGILANNMVETCFSYRLLYFVNFENGSEKHYIDTRYDGLRTALETIIKGNLTVTNTVVLAAVTARKNGETVSLLSRSYPFSLEEYFKRISGEARNSSRNGNIMYGRYAAR